MALSSQPRPQACEHETFESIVGVNRLTSVEGGPVVGFCADLRIKCSQCGQQFKFLGVKGGSYNARQTTPEASLDLTNIYLPIEPALSDSEAHLLSTAGSA